jgi:hypothetical protein
MLLELSPESIDSEEQARIVAVASDIYYKMERQARNKRSRTASNVNASESMMMDSLLQAMGQLSDWSSGEDLHAIDVDNMSPDEIVKIASAQGARFGSVGYGRGMDIINDDDLDVLMRKGDDDDYSLSDGVDSDASRNADDDWYANSDKRGYLHDSSATSPNGWGRHWTDSRAR